MKKFTILLASLLSISSPLLFAYSCNLKEKQFIASSTQLVEYGNEIKVLDEFIKEELSKESKPLSEDLSAATSDIYKKDIDDFKKATEKSISFTNTKIHDVFKDSSIFKNTIKYDYDKEINDESSKEDIYNILEYSFNLQESFLNIPSNVKVIEKENTEWRSSVILKNNIENLKKLATDEQRYKDESNSFVNNLERIEERFIIESFNFLTNLVTNQKLLKWDDSKIKTIVDSYSLALRSKYSNFIKNSSKKNDQEAIDKAIASLDSNCEVIKNMTNKQIDASFNFFLNPFFTDSIQSSTSDSYINSLESSRQFIYKVFYYPVFIKLKNNDINKNEIKKSVKTIISIPEEPTENFFSKKTRVYLDGIVYFNYNIDLYNSIFDDKFKIDIINKEDTEKVSEGFHTLISRFQDAFLENSVEIDNNKKTLNGDSDNYDKLGKKLSDYNINNLSQYEFKDNKLSLNLIINFYNEIIKSFDDLNDKNTEKWEIDIKPVSNPNFFKYKYSESKEFIDKVEKATNDAVDKFTILLESWILTSNSNSMDETSSVSLFDVILKYFKPPYMLDIIFFTYEALKTIYFEKTDDSEKSIYFSLFIQNKFQNRINSIISKLLS